MEQITREEMIRMAVETRKKGDICGGCAGRTAGVSGDDGTSHDSDQRRRCIDIFCILWAERARLYNLYYCEREQQNYYLASSYYATEEQVTGFPPTLVITAGEDSLCTEAEEFALKVARAGSEVTLKRFPGCGHGFTIYRMPGAEKTFGMIEKFIRTGLEV